MPVIPRLLGNAVELTTEECERLFGAQSPDRQERLADLLWACPSPEARARIYATLRNWQAEMLLAEGVRV